MPVSYSQQQDAQAVAFVFSNPDVRVQAITPANYRDFKNIVPKGLRGSMLKVIDWPTSWAILYDLSPAQISQDRERASADSAWNRRAGEDRRFIIWVKLLRAYFVGQSDPMPLRDFPRWRKPYWMTDAQKLEIENFIRDAYDEEVTSEEELGQPMSPMPTEDVPREQRMADLAEREEASAPQVDTEADDEDEESPVQGRELSDNIYALYGSYFRRIYGIPDADAFWRSRNDTFIGRSTKAILVLEKLGYQYRGIDNLLLSLQNRGLSIQGVRQGRRSGFNAYCLVDLKSETNTARRYTTATAFEIMSRTCRVPNRILRDQFETVGGRNLQVFKFTGRPPRMAGLQVLSLNHVNGDESGNGITFSEGNRQVAVAIAETDRQLAVMRGEEGSSETQRPAQTIPETFYFIGFQFFPEGQTYRQNGEFNISLNKFPTDGRTYSYVFYFARENEQGTYDLLRSVFGSLPPDSRIRQQNSSVDRLAQLKMAWNNSGRLASTNSIELQEMPLLDKRKVRQAFAQQEEAGLTTDGINFPVTRSQMRGTPVAFAQIMPPPLAMIVTMGNRFRNLGGIEDALEQAETSTTQDFTISQSDLKRIGQAQMSDSNNIGFEFEGGHPTLRMTALANKFSSKGISMNAESYNHTTRPQWKLVPDASLGGVPNAFELVSPILSGQTGLQNLRECLGVAEQVGCEIYEQGGVHIHFDNRQWDLQTRKNILINQYVMSPWLQATQPKHRRNNRWAKLFKSLDGSYDSFKRRVLEARSESELTRIVRGDRYYEINITNTRQPTWEWRFPQGNIEQDTNINMVRLLDKIIEVSKKGLLSSSDVSEDGMRTWMGTDLFTFWRNRIYDLSQTGSSTQRPSYNHRSII